MGAFNNVLFLTGIIFMAGSAIGGLIALVAFRVSGRRLRRALETEFGKKP